MGDAVGTDLRAVPARVRALWGRDGDYLLHHRGAHRAGDSHLPIGEPSEAPPIAPCRGPPEWEMLDQTVEFDPIHPEPEYEFDQSLSW